MKFSKAVDRSTYAASLLRPFALRARMIARPARVLILSRKPWVRARLILLG